MDEGNDSMREATIFSTVDGSSGFLQIELPKMDRDETTFSSHNGLLQSSRMSLGLKNTLALFQRAVDVTLSKVRW